MGIVFHYGKVIFTNDESINKMTQAQAGIFVLNKEEEREAHLKAIENIDDMIVAVKRAHNLDAPEDYIESS